MRDFLIVLWLSKFWIKVILTIFWNKRQKFKDDVKCEIFESNSTLCKSDVTVSGATKASFREKVSLHDNGNQTPKHDHHNGVCYSSTGDRQKDENERNTDDSNNTDNPAHDKEVRFIHSVKPKSKSDRNESKFCDNCCRDCDGDILFHPILNVDHGTKTSTKCFESQKFNSPKDVKNIKCKTDCNTAVLSEKHAGNQMIPTLIKEPVLPIDDTTDKSKVGSVSHKNLETNNNEQTVLQIIDKQHNHENHDMQPQSPNCSSEIENTVCLTSTREFLAISDIGPLFHQGESVKQSELGVSQVNDNDCRGARGHLSLIESLIYSLTAVDDMVELSDESDTGLLNESTEMFESHMMGDTSQKSDVPFTGHLDRIRVYEKLVEKENKEILEKMKEQRLAKSKSTEMLSKDYYQQDCTQSKDSEPTVVLRQSRRNRASLKFRKCENYEPKIDDRPRPSSASKLVTNYSKFDPDTRGEMSEGLIRYKIKEHMSNIIGQKLYPDHDVEYTGILGITSSLQLEDNSIDRKCNFMETKVHMESSAADKLTLPFTDSINNTGCDSTDEYYDPKELLNDDCLMSSSIYDEKGKTTVDELERNAHGTCLKVTSSVLGIDSVSSQDYDCRKLALVSIEFHRLKSCIPVVELDSGFEKRALIQKDIPRFASSSQVGQQILIYHLLFDF